MQGVSVIHSNAGSKHNDKTRISFSMDASWLKDPEQKLHIKTNV